MNTNTENTLISIIIPIYGAEKTISRCLDSLIAQTYRNIEIICVNDCSPDNSLAILNEYAKKDSRINVITHEQNKRAGGARDTGIKTAKGSYICFVDQDDWLRNDALEKLWLQSENGTIDFVACKLMDYFSPQNQREEKIQLKSTEIDYIIKYTLLNGFRLLGQLIKKDIFIKNNLFFPEHLLWEDNPMGSIFLYIESFRYVPECLYYYFCGGFESQTRSKTSVKKITDRMETSELFLDYAKQSPKYAEYKDYIEYRYLSLSVYTVALIASIPFKNGLPLLKKQYRESKRFSDADTSSLSGWQRDLVKNPLKVYIKIYIKALLKDLIKSCSPGMYNIMRNYKSMNRH